MKLAWTIAATLLCMAVLWWIDLRLIAAGGSIVALELCGAAWPCGTLLQQWDSHHALPWAWASLAFDVPFVVLYPAAIRGVLVRLRAGARASTALRVASPLLTAAAFAAVAAGVLDALENGGEVLMLARGPTEAVAVFTWACAVAKFTAVGAALAVAVVGLCAAAAIRLRNPAP